MRLDMLAMSALIVAGSAAVFGDLGRASSPITPEPLPEILEATSVSLNARTAQPAPAGCVDRQPGRPMATSLQFLEPAAFPTAALMNSDCPSAP